MASYLLRSIIDPILPWDIDEQETSRYNKILIVLLVLSLILSIIIPFIEIEKPDRNKRTTIPPRLVKMVLEQKKKEVQSETLFVWSIANTKMQENLFVQSLQKHNLEKTAACLQGIVEVTPIK